MRRLSTTLLVFYTPFIAALNYDRIAEDIRYLSAWEIIEGFEHALDGGILSSKCADELRQLRAVTNGTWRSNDASIWTEEKRQDLLHSYTSGPYVPFG